MGCNSEATIGGRLDMKHVELSTIVHHVSKFSPEVGRGGGGLLLFTSALLVGCTNRSVTDGE